MRSETHKMKSSVGPLLLLSLLDLQRRALCGQCRCLSPEMAPS
uniref:Uncharacterized protein n=1 Tax=Anguilla anguilla TaxID=7936 RepID=A0A0E9VGG8_ANGAN